MTPFSVAIFTAIVVFPVTPSALRNAYQDLYPREAEMMSAPFSSAHSKP